MTLIKQPTRYPPPTLTMCLIHIFFGFFSFIDFLQCKHEPTLDACLTNDQYALVFLAHGTGILACVLPASIIKTSIAIFIGLVTLFLAIVLLFSFKGLITY